MANKLLHLTEEEILHYLDDTITAWRETRDSLSYSDREREMARHYVDAFQSMRITLFGEALFTDA